MAEPVSSAPSVASASRKNNMSIESIKWNIANNPEIEQYESRLADVLERIELTNHAETADFRDKLEAEREVLEQEIAAIKAQARVEKKIARTRRKALKVRAKVKEFDLGDFLETQKEKRAVTESERLLILEMLQEKKISLDEADQLLKALEGKKK
jgi:hypothetical protein